MSYVENSRSNGQGGKASEIRLIIDKEFLRSEQKSKTQKVTRRWPQLWETEM